MNLSSIAVAQEAIAFQTGDVFKQLTEEFTSLRKQAKGKTIPGKVLYEDGNKNKVLDFTNLVNILNKPGFNFTKVVSGDWATYIPLIKANHILFQNRLKYLSDHYNVDAYKDARSVLVSAGMTVDEGTVSLKNATVSGFFSKLELTLVINTSDIAADEFTPAELAAITLHEQGHIFTAFENLNKTLMTNQALTTCVNAFKAPISSDEKTVVFATTADKLNLDKLGKARLMQAKDEKEVYFVLMNERFNGPDYNYNTGETTSAYHSVSSEYVADEYSTRMGAGAELTTALDKLKVKHAGAEKKAVPILIFSSIILSMLVALPMVLVSANAFILLSTVQFLFFKLSLGQGYAESNKNRLYDHDKARLTRIRNTMVAYLKENDVSVDEVKSSLDKIDEVDKLIEKTSELSPLHRYLDIIASLTSGQYRKERAYELYQNTLEALAHNDLILKSRKLQNIQLTRK